MNNTSAYANVLLKSPALKTAAAIPATVTPKHNDVSDDSSANFRQTFKDVHESQKSQNDTVHKSMNSKKSTQVERHRDAKNTKEVEDIKVTNETAAKQKTTNDSADINRNAIGSKCVREQSAQHKNKDLCADKSTDGEFDQEATNLVADKSSDTSPNTLMASAAVDEMDSGLTQSALVFGTEFTTATEASVPVVADVSGSVDEQILTQEAPVSANTNAVSTTIDSAGSFVPSSASPVPLSGADVVAPFTRNSIASEIIDSRPPLSPLSSKSESGLVAMAPVEPNAITLGIESLGNASISPDTSIKVGKSSEGVGQPLGVNESLLQQKQMQQLIDSSQSVSANQLVTAVAPLDAPVLAAGAMASLLPVKPAQGAVSNESEQAAEILAVLTPETNLSAKLTAKASVPTDVTLDSSNPVTTTQAHIQAAKSAFEKTLQAIVLADASGADDSIAQALNSSSSSSSTNTFMDSLMRGADQQTPAARSFVVQTSVPVPVGQPQWSQAVGEKVLWLAAQNVSSAEINLHPKDLGPIQVRVSVNQEQTTVSFTSQHAVVREVLDQNLNRLRDMFSEQGLNLVNVDVSDKSFSRQQGDAQGQKGQSGAHDVAQNEETAVAMSAIVQQRLVDHYA